MIRKFNRILFQSYHLKIKQGRRHASQLETAIATYLSDDPWAIFKFRNKKTGTFGILTAGRGSIPEEFSLIFGDAVHNFRAALDILAKNLVAFSGTKPDKVYLPFANSQDGFERELKCKMRGARPDILDVVRAFSPFKGGNELLRAVHDLDIGDKHVDLIRVAISCASPPLPNAGTLMASGNEFVLEIDLGALKSVEVNLSGYTIWPAPNIEVVGKILGASSAMTVADGLPMAGKDPFVVLNEMGNLVEDIGETFESLCLGCCQGL